MKRYGRISKFDGEEYQTWFPLYEWGWDREECLRQIAQAGLPAPVKSACFFCPASHPEEITALARDHRDLFDLAISIEDTALSGGKVRKTGGLWRSAKKCGTTWRDYAERNGMIRVNPEDHK